MGTRILLTGATGFLGHYLVDEIRRRDLGLVTAGRRGTDIALELASPDSIRAAVSQAGADLTLHAAALSTIGGCEADPQQADVVNHLGSGILAHACKGRLVLVSTDLVFGGCAAPYHPVDSTAPVSVYARTKERAERTVLDAGGTVVRVPLLFGRSHDGRRGATDAIRNAQGRIGLFTNEYRTPLHAADTARGLIEILLECEGPRVLHLAGPERVSRFELGQRFVVAAGLTGFRLDPTRCEDALRPPDVSLISDWDCKRSLETALAES